MKPHHRKKLLRLLLGATALAACAWYLLPLAFPLPENLTATPKSPILLDRHGEPLHHLTLPDFTRSQPVPLSEIPDDLIACTLAAEDKRFFTHSGIDLLATARAVKDRITHGRTISGASTITQQLVKIASPKAPRTLKTKLREALTARHLELSWSKDQILEAYLNRLDYGHNRLGPTEAARYYFQKPLADLSLAECALLAGLPQSPSRLNPTRHPARALTRRATVLTRLANTGNYQTSSICTAESEPLQLRPLRRSATAPWLASFPDLQPQTSDLQTTLDAPLQRQIETIVTEELTALAEKNLHHAAVVVIHNPTGDILALVSSGNWDDPRGGQINGALAPRSPGSALKPFTYLLSFEKSGRFPGSIVADIPTRFRTKEGLDLPENFDRHFRGPVTIRQALACSLNVPAMRELNDLGGPEPLHSFLQQLGITTLDPDPIPYGLGLTLGNAPVNLLELTNAYAILARSGTPQAPTLFKNTQSPNPQSPIFSAQAAFLIADILSDPTARAPAFGRHGPLELPFRCATKTGTSSDFRDNWCLGYTAEFTVGVWAGNFDNSPMKGLSGVAGAGPIFHRTMQFLHRNTPPSWFEKPSTLAQITIDPRTGKSLTPWHAQPGHNPQKPEQNREDISPKRAHPSMTGTVMPRTHTTPELCPTNSLPLPASPSDYSPKGLALLDQSYSEWLGSSHNQRRDDFALAPDHPAITALRILAPRPDATYILDPELPNGGHLHLATNLPGLAKWHSETLTLTHGDLEPIATLTPGTHTLIATDPRNGESIPITLKVVSR